MNIQMLLRIINCMSYDDFEKIFMDLGQTDEQYIMKKWRQKSLNLAEFLMDGLDSNIARIFEEYAIKKSQKQIITDHMIAQSGAIQVHKE